MIGTENNDLEELLTEGFDSQSDGDFIKLHDKSKKIYDKQFMINQAIIGIKIKLNKKYSPTEVENAISKARAMMQHEVKDYNSNSDPEIINTEINILKTKMYSIAEKYLKKNNS